MNRLIEDRLRKQRMIAGAGIFSLVLYAGIGFLSAAQGDIVPTPLPEAAPGILAAAAVCLLIITGPIVSALIRKSVGKTEPAARLDGVTTAVVIGMAIRESPGIIGLVLTFLTGDPRWVVGLSGLSILAMIAAFPRRSTLENLLRDVPPIG